MRGRSLLVAAGIGAAVLPALAQSNPALELFVRPDKGHCIACHQLPAGAGRETRSDLGPRLEGERMRALGKTRLREIIADPVRFNAQTVMPPYGRHRILDAGEIAILADFLHALP